MGLYDDYSKVINGQPSSDGISPSNYGVSTAWDWLGGNYGAKEQATRQSQLDFEQWLRNEVSAKQQRDFELYMSNTQVQRAMADLKAAGLNPWLAVQSAGFGGAVPSGAVATSSAGQAAAANGSNGLQALGTSALGIAALIKVITKILK